MPTQRDLDTAAEVTLPICEKCGWYDGYMHHTECRPELGRAAARLIEAVASVRAGQLGYGDGHVVFDLHDDFSVVFAVDRRTFSLRNVHLIDNLDLDEAASLVRALKDWMDETAAKRRTAKRAHDTKSGT